MLHIRLWDFNIVNYCPKLIKLFLWESKMCRHGLQLLGMLYNVLGMLLVVHCSLNFTAYKAVSGGVSLQCGTPRTLQKHAEVGQGGPFYCENLRCVGLVCNSQACFATSQACFATSQAFMVLRKYIIISLILEGISYIRNIHKISFII